VSFPYVDFYFILLDFSNKNDSLGIVSGDMGILLTSWL